METLQNVDDAGGKSHCNSAPMVLADDRIIPDTQLNTSLIKVSLITKVLLLLVYNDREFTEDDFDSL